MTWASLVHAAVRSAKVRDKVLAVLVKHHHLLTNDGKQFRLNPLAEAADSAETQQPCSFAVADDLRKFAEVARITPAARPVPAKLPQTSANLPQAETQQSRGLPQNPQNPQPPASANAAANYEEF